MIAVGKVADESRLQGMRKLPAVLYMRVLNVHKLVYKPQFGAPMISTAS